MKLNLTIGTAALALALVGMAAVPALAKELTYGSYIPATHLANEQGLTPFFERVTAATNGELKFKLFAGGAMGGPKESLKSVQDSIVDSSLVIDAYLKRSLPVSATLTGLQLLADDPLVFGAAANEFHLLDCPQCKQELAMHRMKGLAWYSTASYFIQCAKPVSKLSDLTGLKIRTTGSFGVMAKDMGATPVSITTGEMYEAMQRGTTDCTVGSTAWLNEYNLKDVVKSVINMPVGAYFAALVYNMNVNTWKGLTDKQRTAIVKNLPKLVADINFSYISEGEAALKAATKVAVNKPGADLKAKLAEIRKSQYEGAIKAATAAGVKNPKAIVDGFLAKVDKWRKIVAATGRDQAKYEQALWREIFSKVH